MADGASQSPLTRLAFVGPHKVGGRAKGTYISVVRATRRGVQVGVDGEGGFTDNGDGSATITIVLTPSSRSNLVFSAYEATGLAFPIVVQEKGGSTVGECTRAVFEKQADITWTDGAETRTWVAQCTSWQGIVGDIGAMELAEVDESEL